MILSLMRLKGQIDRSREIISRNTQTVNQQVIEERVIDRKFRQNVEVAQHVLNSCQNERHLVSSTIQQGLADARRAIKDRGTNARINSGRIGKEAVRSITEGFSGIGLKVAGAKN